MSRNTQSKSTSRPLATVRKMTVGAVLLTATFGFVGAPGADAQYYGSDCNKLHRSGQGYYGCGGIDHAWEHLTWEWTLYYW